jgi:broad specificity phosphatase PhoE
VHAVDAAWEALRMPGSVVVVRHSYAPGSFDLPDARLEDCSTQRNLNADGRAQARRLGEAFRQHGIVVGRVLSSPRCRCLDTARLAFGRAETWDVLQGALRDADCARAGWRR